MRSNCFMSNKQKLSLLAIAFGVVSLSGCLPQEQSLPSTSGSTAPNTYLGFIGATAAQTMGATKVQLTWVPSSSSTVVAYNISDSTFKFSPKLIKTILAPASSVLLTGLVAESYYAFRVRAAASENASLCRAAADPARGLRSGAQGEGSGSSRADVYVHARCEPMHRAGGTVSRTVAGSRRAIDGDRPKANASRAIRVGCEHAHIRWTSGARLEHDWMFSPPSADRILERRAARCHWGSRRPAEKDLLMDAALRSYEEERCI